MNEDIESILLQFKTAIDFAKGPSKIKYNFEISDAEKLYDYVINLQKENQILNNIIKFLKKYFKEHECYEETLLLEQLESEPYDEKWNGWKEL